MRLDQIIRAAKAGKLPKTGTLYGKVRVSLDGDYEDGLLVAQYGRRHCAVLLRHATPIGLQKVIDRVAWPRKYRTPT